MKSLVLGDKDVLNFAVSVQRVHAQIPADTALLVAPKRGFDMDTGVGIDAQDPTFHLTSHPDGAGQMLCPDGSTQPVWGVVDFLEHG